MIERTNTVGQYITGLVHAMHDFSHSTYHRASNQLRYFLFQIRNLHCPRQTEHRISQHGGIRHRLKNNSYRIIPGKLPIFSNKVYVLLHMIIGLITLGLLFHFTSPISIVHPLSWVLQDRNANFRSRPLERKSAFKTYSHNKRYSVATFHHVGKPFTQGLTIRTTNCTSPGKELDKCIHHNNQAQCYQAALHKCGVILYESAGLYGQSKIQKITNFDTGRPDYSMALPPSIFAEGLQYVPANDMLILGSWREQLLFLIHDTGSSFQPIQTVRTDNLLEHWGITVVGNKILATSGEDKLFSIDLPLWIDKQQFAIANVTKLHCNNRAVHQVNELEFDAERNSIWGNIWLEDLLMEFDYETGECKGSLDLNFLNKMEARKHRDAVWNGVAALGNDWMFLTGKIFANIYLLKLQ